MIPRELLKGSLKSVVLKLLAENGRMYGYEITQKIEELSNGKIKLTYGALYPVLHKLENDGEVTIETENVNNRIRIYYLLTKKGNTLASKSIDELAEFIETISLIINSKPSTGMSIC
jgi:PadR family transcriptional regulator, regulatory protein PadR